MYLTNHFITCFFSVLVMFIEPDGPAYELNLRGKVVTRAVQLVQPNNGDVGQEGVSYNSGKTRTSEIQAKKNKKQTWNSYRNV